MATSEKVPPLVDFKVNNPVTYIKLWWAKVMDKEGIDLSFRIHPITVIVSAAVVATIGFGAGRFIVPDRVKIPFFEFGLTPTVKPSFTSEPVWKETAFTGKLQHSSTTQKYFLITTSSEAITLSVPSNINLEPLIGKRIIAVGEYNKQEKLLKVIDAKDMEVLPKTPVPVPTVVATLMETISPVPTATETGQPEKNNVD